MLKLRYRNDVRPQSSPLTSAIPISPTQKVEPWAGSLLQKVLALPNTRAGFKLASGLLLLAAFFLRVWRLGAHDLWLDEGISYFVANRPPLDVIAYSAQNISEHPPGYYFGLHFWMQLAGTSEFALRFLSALGGLIYFALVLMLARRWFGKRLALLVGAFFCLQPLSLTLGRDTRMYTWYGVAVLSLLFLFDRAIHDHRVRHWVYFGLAAFVALSVNYLTVFVLVALAIFAVVHWRELGHRNIPFAIVLLIVLGLPFLWVILSPGPRGSLGVLLSTLRTPWTPGRLVSLYFGFPLSGAADEAQPFSLWLLAGLRWVLAIAGIALAVAPRGWQRRTFQWFLALLIFIPPVAASLVFPVVKQRFFSATLGLFVVAVALGIAACWRRFKPLGPALATTLFVAILILDGRYAAGQIGGQWQPFSVPIKYILERAQPGETIVYTYPWDKYLDLYYNAGQQPIDFVPAGENPATPEMSVDSANKALAKAQSVWLVMYPTALNPEVVEQGFNQIGYPGPASWFDGSRGVIRYFPGQPVTEQPGGMVWGDRISLDRWSMSGPQVAAGDALRLQFNWRDLADSTAVPQKPGGPSELIELSLVGADGQTWATRIAAPCNGLCPLSKWGDKPVEEREAFYIPADTPPGKYAVRLRWLTSAGEPMLARRSSDAAPQAFVQLLDAEVLPPVSAGREAPLDEVSGAATSDGRLRLESFTPPASGLPGSPLTLPMRFSVVGPVERLEARLILRRNGKDEILTQPLGPAWYGSDAWTQGRLVRAQPTFVLPPSAAPGSYDMKIELGPAGDASNILRVQAGSLTVRDREHHFETPSLGLPASAEWQEGIHLARVLTPTEVNAGEAMTVTLVWRADRPTAGNWKVFVHLVDALGVVRGQGDAYPAGGAALTPTWIPGEIVTDVHRIELSKDLPVGEYDLHIGFYNESTDERLPLGPGVDTFTWTQPIELKQP